MLHYRTLSFSEQVLRINNGDYPLIFPEEWSIITETDERNSFLIE